MSGEDARLMDKIYIEFVRNGMLLDEEKRGKLTDHMKKISELQLKFQKNVSEDSTSLTFSKEELQGLDDDFLVGLKKDGDKFIVTMKVT